MNNLANFRKTYGMEVTKTHPLVTMCEHAKDLPSYNRALWLWHDFRSRIVASTNLEKLRQLSYWGGACTSLARQCKFNVPEALSISSYPPAVLTPHGTWKPSVDYTRFSLILNPNMTFESYDVNVLDTSTLRDVTQKLMSIFRFQRICDLVNEFSDCCEAYVMNDTAVNLMMDKDRPSGKADVQNVECDSVEFCRSVSKLELVCPERSMGDRLHVNENCASAMEAQGSVKSQVNGEEMGSRDQRQMEKLCKKRKIRMKKNTNCSRACTVKGRTSVTGRISHKSSQKKCRGKKFCGSYTVRSSSILNDWEDSDEDLCIVFDDEISNVDDILPKNCNTGIAQIPDVWVEFDSLVCDTDDEVKPSHSSETSVNCGSDLEYEEDLQQSDGDEVDSWSGLFFVGSSGLNVLCDESLKARSSLYECPLENNDYDLGSREIHEINRRWQKMNLDVGVEPRLPQKVSFAPEEDLIVVFPVDVIDRTSDWEQFALARFRFKRRVDEFEKIITPYFAASHREKIYRSLGVAAS